MLCIAAPHGGVHSAKVLHHIADCPMVRYGESVNEDRHLCTVDPLQCDYGQTEHIMHSESCWHFPR
jgi:hypothetical protein